MSKTITLRVDDDVYTMLKMASDGAKRTISNFLEYAALTYLTQDTYVSEAEMNEIMHDKELLKNIRAAGKDIREGRYTVVR
jgi:hypothetical protein